MAYQTSKNKSRAVTQPAKGDAPNTGAPGPTPAPVRTYKNPLLTERDETPGYGNAKNLGPSSVPPGAGAGDSVSALGQELKRVNALSDAGDLLQDIVERGVARDTMVELQSPQTRQIDNTPYPIAHGMSKRGVDSGSPGSQVPAKNGNMSSDFDARRAAAVKRTV